MMAELKLADDIQDPRLEEPVNDILSKENISTSEPPLVLLTSSEERKRKRHITKRKRNGPKIPKQSKAVEGHNCGTCGIHAGGKLHQCKIQATLSYSADKQKLTVVVHRCCNLPMEPDDPEELPDPYVKCYLNPGDSYSED
ncbi:unnamed protein product [Cyprideis torosa]|uniref:C2 domain-containing protein n=1 Tax=Cyprideis torosa TaxID=163714 RepID=A0A7R8ZRD5_9CRUS|nr:unnamed protein product [Cyprideis torosa]CAG0903460.1 unnamed protein product [Cyprideis torosa]